MMEISSTKWSIQWKFMFSVNDKNHETFNRPGVFHGKFQAKREKNYKKRRKEYAESTFASIIFNLKSYTQPENEKQKKKKIKKSRKKN